MRIVLQRVSRASVSIEGRVAGRIGRGFVLLAGFHATDTAEQVDWMADKVAGLRLFADAEGKMNLGLAEVGGRAPRGQPVHPLRRCRQGAAALVHRRRAAGTRRSRCTSASWPRSGRAGLEVETGEFGADMQVEIS